MKTTAGLQTDTSYLGLRLAHPFVAGASPLGYRLDTIKRLEDAGCAAVALHSLFEEQITLAAEGRVGHMDPLDRDFAETLAHFPPASEYPFTRTRTPSTSAARSPRCGCRSSRRSTAGLESRGFASPASSNRPGPTASSSISTM